MLGRGGGGPCDGIAFEPGGNRNTLSRFVPQKPRWAPAWWATRLVCRLFPDKPAFEIMARLLFYLQLNRSCEKGLSRRRTRDTSSRRRVRLYHNRSDNRKRGRRESYCRLIFADVVGNLWIELDFAAVLLCLSDTIKRNPNLCNNNNTHFITKGYLITILQKW